MWRVERRRARVAHIVPTDRIAYLLLRARLMRLRAAGFEISVLCGKVACGGELERCGVRLIHIPFAREIELRTNARCLRALYEVLRRERFDLVHSHNPMGGLLGPVAAQLARIPVVAHTVHGFLFNENSRGLQRLLALGAERWTARWCDHLLFQSAEDHAYALEHAFKAPPRLHLLGNGVDERRFDPGRYAQARRRKRRELGLEERHLVVGMVGRLVREKGFVEFFAMAGRIARRRVRARFLVVGITEKEQSDSLDALELMAAHGLEGRCILLEQRRDMPELYLSMDLAVLPSHREGLPRALMEASCMGLPVVASDIRGCREVVKAGETGLLFPPRDLDAFVEAVECLLDDAPRRRRLGAAGRRRILEHYTESRTAARLVACYERMLEP